MKTELEKRGIHLIYRVCEYWNIVIKYSPCFQMKYFICDNIGVNTVHVHRNTPLELTWRASNFQRGSGRPRRIPTAVDITSRRVREQVLGYPKKNEIKRIKHGKFQKINKNLRNIVSLTPVTESLGRDVSSVFSAPLPGNCLICV